MFYNPYIISKCLSTQATYIKYKYGQMFYFTDKGQIYYDTQDNRRILANDIFVLQYERERLNYVPDNLSTFATEYNNLSNQQIFLDTIYIYVVETNCLYKYNFASRTWTIIYGTYSTTLVGQTTTPEGNIIFVNADDVTTNGILNDGSVVVRDQNKMICGIFKSSGYTLNMQSLIGGQINIDPSGTVNGNGCLQLNANKDININGNVNIFGRLNKYDTNDWYKQYRLVTEDITINSYSLIKKGSLIYANSLLDDTRYVETTKITEDITFNSGIITTNSKLYINSIINNLIIQPPYLFDVDNNIDNNIITKSFWSIDNNILKINKNSSSFVYPGDCYYIYDISEVDLSNVTEVQFLNQNYKVDTISSNLGNIAIIKYYGYDFVKILP